MAQSTLDLLRSRREEILALAAQYGVDNIRVFGSVARGEDKPDSDIDFLIRIARDRSLTDFVGFKLDTEELLDRKCDIVSENGMNPLLQGIILSEARPL
jgi:predicted nucleotidyltransferase